MKKALSLLLTLALVCAAIVLPVSAEEAKTPSLAIVVAGSFGDRSFYDSAKEGGEQLESEFGTKVLYIECGEDASRYQRALNDAAKECDIVAAVGWQFYDALDTVPDNNKDTKFVFIDNAMDEMPDNLMCVTYAQNEGSFLAGYIGAKLSANASIGAVGGEDADTINDFLIGYEAGAKYANPDAKVSRQYANTYEDPAKGKECALALYTSGADVVFAVAGKTGEGVFEAAKEYGKGVLAIGVDGDQKYINPDLIICSMVKKVGKSLYDIVSDPDSYYKGGEVWNANMATGYIDVVYGTEDMPQQASDELKAEVEELKAKIISGEIVVPSAFE
ncbi:MAG: BMP family ABC transporter substrate-binding protein [Clostridia bacterium]|nr:BMP family ABC transporter substrate-binding protein [Clostridia bacterium]